MIEIINNLKEKEIIYRKSVEILKQYITKKHPEADETYRARVFADAVHKIIDDHIKTFNRKDQKTIKSALLASVADKAIFEISAYDIMKTCVSLDMDEDDFVQDLTSWLNQEQSIPVNKQILTDISLQVKEEIHKENQLHTIDREAAALLNQLEAAFVANEKEFEGYKVMDTSEEQMNFFNHSMDEEDDGTLDHEALSYTTYERRELNIENAFSEPSTMSTVRNKSESFVDEMSIDALNEHIEEKRYSTYLEEDIYEDVIRFEDEELELEEADVDKVEEPADARPVIVVERERQMGMLIHRSNKPPVEEVQKKWYEILWTYIRSGGYKDDLKYIIPITIGFVLIIVVLLLFMNQSKADVEIGIIEKTNVGRNDMMSTLETTTEDDGDAGVRIREIDASHLDPSIQYKKINKDALVQWLNTKNALIADDQYIENVLAVAAEYGVNPLLLVAIMGQEQDFVPRNHPDAMEMINNPFNVYESWQIYNTDFDEATRIAARTILTASENKPEDQKPIEWINNRYAEDPKWHIGVTLIFEELEKVAGQIE